jgi:hypothetical protein
MKQREEEEKAIARQNKESYKANLDYLQNISNHKRQQERLEYADDVEQMRNKVASFQ